MDTAYTEAENIFKKINFKEYSFEDVQRMSLRQRIHIQIYKMPADVRGYYSTTLRKIYRKKCIVLNEGMGKAEKTYVALHELIHHFFHVTTQITQTFYCKTSELIDAKHDLEADQLALILMIPKWKLWELKHTPSDEIELFLQGLLVRRQQIYIDFGY